jgi:hypothetical protein
MNDNDILLLKYDSSLNFKWKKTYTHIGNDWGLSLALDKNYNIALPPVLSFPHG